MCNCLLNYTIKGKFTSFHLGKKYTRMQGIKMLATSSLCKSNEHECFEYLIKLFEKSMYKYKQENILTSLLLHLHSSCQNKTNAHIEDLMDENGPARENASV
ncbi:uncharacterized protein LOC119672662 [Teleopsis dalmanni]|uniref:uncharacterized protein LOC119672662 n=1 Tax=Teleopsis dalmanni TaxID=139649 RepID=UPI0018CF1EA6|nr:uncharacterized protein LOC119672662 [Teleopsis dalmanni]